MSCEVVVAYFKLVYPNINLETEENHETISEQTLNQLQIEPGTSQVQV